MQIERFPSPFACVLRSDCNRYWVEGEGWSVTDATRATVYDSRSSETRIFASQLRAEMEGTSHCVTAAELAKLSARS